MAFFWKSPKDIWKGEGIYHLTFVVNGRKKLLGELVALADSCGEESNRSYVEDVERPKNTDGLPYDGWRKELCVTELATVRLSAFALAISRDLKALPERFSYAATNDEPALIICGKQFMPDHLHVVVWVKTDLGKSIRQIGQGAELRNRQYLLYTTLTIGGHYGLPMALCYVSE